MTTQQDLPSTFHVAIIGAGLAGLNIALSLHAQSISCTVYESSPAPQAAIKGSLNLAPNGQAALSSHPGLLDRLAKRSTFFRSAHIHDIQGNVVSELLLGHKDYFNHDAMRIIRGTLIQILVEEVLTRGIAIECSKKFARVVNEPTHPNESTLIQFTDNTTATANLIIGVDGIHSKVRQAIFPTAAAPVYIGNAVVAAAVAADKMPGLTPEHTGMYLGDQIGTFLMGPHTPGNTDYMVALQKPYPDQGKDGWKAMQNDPKQLQAFLAAGKEKWIPQLQAAIEHARPESYYLWPLYSLPTLPSWLSTGGRVLLAGDAAHAIPPSGGQGANQAFEDGYTLALVLGAVKNGKRSLEEGLQFWQEMRRERIGKVLEMTMQWNKMRQPKVEAEEVDGKVLGNAVVESERIQQMKWVYGGVQLQGEKIREWGR